MALPLDVGLAIGTLQRARRACKDSGWTRSTEEEPGRIMHEIRRGPASHRAYWAVTVYYGSVDATPLFVMLLAEAGAGARIEAAVRALLPAADAALALDRRPTATATATASSSTTASTDRGLINQGWKDSFDGINDADGAPCASRRWRSARCRATSMPRCLPRADWPRGSATRRGGAAAGSGRRATQAVRRGLLAARKRLVRRRSGRGNDRSTR